MTYMGRASPEHLSSTQVSAGRLRSKTNRGTTAAFSPALPQCQESLPQPLPTRSDWAFVYTICTFSYQNKAAKTNPLPHTCQNVTSETGKDGGVGMLRVTHLYQNTDRRHCIFCCSCLLALKPHAHLSSLSWLLAQCWAAQHLPARF